ncbi:MAG TPA: hypothetical protein VHA11_03765, partial [Bryobacteraceae bacterium]|nr:hypothetical protein [Bryobacteraceae bacterium]
MAAYAKAHANDRNGLLAHLALGVSDYESRDYPSAIAQLKMVQGKLPAVADYTGYYLGAALVESKQGAAVPQALAPVRAGQVPSPMAGRSWILEARALAPQPAQAIRILHEHYADLPQPEGDLALADSYRAANDLPHAVEYYQGILYRFFSGAASTRAEAALAELKTSMGAAYPPPNPSELLRRAGRLMEARDYDGARAQYLVLPDQLTGLEKARAQVGIGAADLLSGKLSAATQYLRNLSLAPSEGDAERLYYLEECASRSGSDAGIQSAVAEISSRYPNSVWRLKALASAAGHFLIVNQPDNYIPLYRAAYENFPDSTAAGLYHWKVAFHAYIQGDRDAEDLLREHLARFPDHATAPAALYFLSRQAERRGEFGAARAYYRRLNTAFPNTYYGMQARDRLKAPEVAGAPSAPEAEQFAAGIRFPVPAPVPSAPTRATTLRIERSRTLRAAGLDDMADAELRFGARNDGQPLLLGLEMAANNDAPSRAMRIMKSTAQDYLRMPIDRAPRKMWELLFPLPYRRELERYARERKIDP